MSEEKLVNSSTPPFICPAISVVIPMYNTEKYIGECLDSLLEQTFKNFEVIVVDDCSTDNSVAVAESYISKFNGQLRVTKLKQNSGNASFPRNKGIAFSRGDYIFFLDSDDAITPTGLEELYSQAKNFDADIIHCEKYYDIPDNLWHDAEFRKSLKPTNYLTGERIWVKNPIIWENNFEERIKFFVHNKLVWNSCLQLIRHDFILDNELHFCNIFAEDRLFTICELLTANKFVIVPNVIYYYRKRKGSKTTSGLNLQDRIHRELSVLKTSFNYIDEVLNGREFFSQNPELKYLLFDFIMRGSFRKMLGIYQQNPAQILDEILRNEVNVNDNAALFAYIFYLVNTYRLQLNQAQSSIQFICGAGSKTCY